MLRKRRQMAVNDNRRIATSLVIVSFFVLCTKSVSALKEMAIAWRYGTNGVVDGYLFVFELISFPIAIFFYVLTLFLVPIISANAIETQDKKRFSAELFGLFLLLGAIGYFITWLSVHTIINCGAAGLSGQAHDTALAIIPGFALLIPIGLLVSLWSTWTMAHGGHRNTLYEGIPALVILAMVLIFAPASEVLLWGTIGGFAIQAVLLALPLARTGKIEVPQVSFTASFWPSFRHGFIILLAAQTLLSVGILSDQFFAARLSEGSIASLGYANRILWLVLGLGATAISRAVLPVFGSISEFNNQHRGQMVKRWVWITLLAGIIATVVGWMLAPWVVRELFQRGAFSASDSANVARLFRFNLLIVPFYLPFIVLVNDLVTQGRYATYAIFCGINLIIKITLLTVLVPAFGLIGIPLSSAFMFSIAFVILLWDNRNSHSISAIRKT